MIKLLLIITLLCINCTLYAEQKILLLGDSLSAAYGIPKEQSWVNLLRNKLKQIDPEFEIINASITGSTTANGLKQLPELLKSHQPDWVLLELGGNDGLRGLSLKSMKINLEKMIKLSKNAGAKVILIGIKIPPNYGPVYTRMFDKVYSQLSKQYDLPLVPFLLKDVAIKPELMLPDRLHPNEKAQPIIFNTVWQTIKSNF